MKMKRCSFALFALVLSAMITRADLKWDQTTIEVHSTVFDESAVARFKFKNVGTTPVHIISAQPSCGLPGRNVEKTNIPPGDKGEVTATLNIGDRFGRRKKPSLFTRRILR